MVLSSESTVPVEESVVMERPVAIVSVATVFNDCVVDDVAVVVVVVVIAVFAIVFVVVAVLTVVVVADSA